MTKEINYLLGYENIKIVQDKEMFKFSLDSVLLPNFVTINLTTKKILDIGTGNAPIPLILSTKTNAKITAIEIQNDVYELAKESIILNNKQNQIEVINKDINILYNELKTETYDIITCNPPYFKINPKSIYNKNEYKTLARHEVALNLEQLIKISKKLLKNGGTLDIVHRPERLIEIIELMKLGNIEPKKIQFIHPKKGEDANILLIEGKKNGNSGIKVLSPMYVYDDLGNYTEEILKYFTN